MEIQRLVIAIGVSFAVAFALRRTLRWHVAERSIAWALGAAAIASTAAVNSLDATMYRLAAAIVAVATLTKLYDLYRSRERAERLSASAYFAYLANWFWLVLSERPPRVPARRDRTRLAIALPVATLAAAAFAALYALDWSGWPFWVEHCAKVAALHFAVTRAANSAACVWRLSGGEALHPMRYPELAPTPAEFWRRWNVPTQRFLREYVHRPFAARGPIVAVAATFGVSGLVHEFLFWIAGADARGWQLGFFSLQGVAVLATYRWRPNGWLVVPCLAATTSFNLASSTLFYRSVEEVVPFYSRRDSIEKPPAAASDHVGVFSSSMP